MFRITQMGTFFALTLAVLMVSSIGMTDAFTTDAGIKMIDLDNIRAVIQPARQPTKRETSPSPTTKQIELTKRQESNHRHHHHVKVSLIDQENIRKSITVPPSYEDYMVIRERSLAAVPYLE